MSSHPDVWSNYSNAAATMTDLSITQNVHPNADTEDICYVKFIPGIGTSGRMFAEAPLQDLTVMTLLRSEDGMWQVWGISSNHFPSANRVIHGIPDQTKPKGF